ncbi:hypothetical protein [Streptomyces xylophagus]|uniref:hypothetical protein n=1 Tax=Streptomyces xylophagus TaxID=285514 RepID=UPI00131B84CB|nr:hypothetical protein [Streptomyces xylophagus]
MSQHSLAQAQQLEELRKILLENYGYEAKSTEAAEIADWLKRFYTALVKLGVQRRVAEREAVALRKRLSLDDSQK